MVISYKKLWKLLIDKDLKKKDLPALVGISRSSITKMGHNENVNTEILVKTLEWEWVRDYVKQMKKDSD